MSAKVTKTSGAIPKPTVSGREVRLFVSYSHADSAIRDKLEVHLAALKRDGVVTWYDGDMQAGDALDTEIARALRQAHLFVALLSPDYLASHYCWKLEYQRAMGRRAKGTLRVAAVVVRPCDWKATTAAGFKLLPTDGKPVSRWRSQDQALLDVTQGIRRVVQAIRKEASAQGTSAPRARAAKAGSIAGAQASAKRVPVPARKRAVRNPSKTKRRWAASRSASPVTVEAIRAASWSGANVHSCSLHTATTSAESNQKAPPRLRRPRSLLGLAAGQSDTADHTANRVAR